MLLVPLLLGVELLDELYSGIPSVGSADIQAGFGVSYTLTASALLFVPGVMAFFIEPILFVLADRYPRKWFVCGGLFAMACAAFVAAAASNMIVLALALGVAFIGSGSGVALSQATLVDARPHERERVLTRWTLFGEIGDLLAPALLATLAAVSLGWRSAYVCVGVFVLVWAVLLLGQPFSSTDVQTDVERDPSDDPEAPSDDETEPGVLVALTTAIANRRLLFWLGATALCDLLDEIVVVFAALYLRDRFGATAIERSFILGAGIGGALLGVMLTDRLLTRVPALRLLLGSSLLCIAAYVAWLFAPTVWLSTTLFLAVCITAAPMYPIASAQAYAVLPGRSGTVNAAGHVFTPFSLALPWVLGLVADHAGVRAALVVLLLQPIGLVIIALVSTQRLVEDRGRAKPAIGP